MSLTLRGIFAFCTVFSICAFADTPKPAVKPAVSSPAPVAARPELRLPDRVSHEDAIEIENAQLKMQLAQMKYDVLYTKWFEVIERIGKKYQFDHLKNADDVNFETGIITRKGSPPKPAPPKSPPPPPPAKKPESKPAELKK